MKGEEEPISFGSRASYGTSDDMDTDGDSSPTAPRTVRLDDEMEAIGFGRFHYRMLAILGLANASDAVELLCLSFILPCLPASDVTDAGKASLSAAIFVGMLVGGLFFGVSSDTYGRRTMLAISLAVNAGFGLLSASSSNFALLIFSRVMAGFGVGGSVPGVFTLAAELLPAKGRGYWLSTVAWWWMVGSLWAAGAAWLMIGYLKLPWQWYAAVCAVPAATASALTYFLLPESPRFLLSRGDASGAARALAWIAVVNRTDTRMTKGYSLQLVEVHHEAGSKKADADSEDTGLLAVGVGAAAVEEGIQLDSIDGDGGSAGKGGAVGHRASTSAHDASNAGGTPSKSKAVLLTTSSSRGRKGYCGACSPFSTVLQPVRDFFSTGQKGTSALLMVVWFCLSFGWYGLILWIPTLFAESDIHLDAYQDSFVVAAANLPGNVLSAFAMDKIGRKGVLASSLFAACAFAAGMPFARTEVAAVAVACSLNAVSTATWNALDCLSTESFPTHLRTSAMGILSATGRAGSIVGQFVFGSLIHVSVGALLGSAAGMLGIGALAALALPADPMGKELED